MKRYIRANEEDFENLANDEYAPIRWKVALNPNTPVKILEKLAEDEDWYVRLKVACNPNAPVDILEKLANDEDEEVRGTVADNPNTPVKILEKLASDENKDVRKWVAHNTNTPVEILKKLANDKEQDVRWEVANNTNTPSELRGKLVNKRNSNSSWRRLISTLQSEIENGTDPLYEQTEAGQELESICTKIEDKLGVWLEPSVAGGIGGIWFYSKEDDSVLVEDYDYQTYNEEVMTIAIGSESKEQFKRSYKSYLQNIIDEYEENEI